MNFYLTEILFYCCFATKYEWGLGAIEGAMAHVKVRFPECVLMEVKIHCKNALGLRIVWSLEVVRLPMYYEILNP